MPDLLKKRSVARRFTHLDGIARPRETDLKHGLDLARARGTQDDAVGQRQSLAEIVRHQQDRLLLAFPDPQQHLMHIDLGMGIQGAKRLVHQKNLRFDHYSSMYFPIALAPAQTTTLIVAYALLVQG
jgi:hypothetical protein